MQPQTYQSQTTPSNNPKNIKLLVILASVFIMLFTGFLIYQSQRFYFQGTNPQTSKVGLNTTIALKYSKNLSNRSDIMSNLSITPKVKVNIVVEKNSISIVPVTGYELKPYTVTIPTLKSGNKTILSQTLSFTPRADIPANNEATEIDLEDIPAKQYPELANIDTQPNENYKVSYDFDGEKIIFKLYLREPLRVEDETQAIKNLRDYENQARTLIRSYNIPTEKYVITFESRGQQKLLYGSSTPPTN